MKIALISDWYPPKLGGVETLVYEQAKYMNMKKGVDVEVITQDFSGPFSFEDRVEERDGIRVRRLSGVTLPFWKIYFHPELPFKIKELFKKEDYDVVHSHHFFTLLSTLSTIIAREMHPRRGCVAITNHTYHAKLDSFVFNVPKMLSSFAMKSADRVFVGSDAASKLPEKMGDAGKIRKVMYGVPRDEFNPEKRSEELRKELGVESGVMILYVGRFGKRKGVEYLLQAMNQVKEEVEKAKLILIGKGPKEKNYQKLIRKSGLMDCVRIEGFKGREELQRYYASSDLTVFPSVRDESFGRIIPESMASETPYVATDIPGFDEVHEEGAGYLVPPKDSDALAEKIIELCKDEGLRRDFGRRGRKIAADKFDWNGIVDQMLEVYDEVIS